MSCCDPLILLKSPDFSILKSLLVRFDLLEAVLSLQNGTVFCPTNCAFKNAKINPDKIDPDDLLNVLLYHVSPQQNRTTKNQLLCSLLENYHLLTTRSMVNNLNIEFSCRSSTTSTIFAVISEVLIPLTPPNCNS